MKTPWAIEPELHWTEHFIKYGFAVLEKAVEPDFIEAALDEVRRLVGSDLPLEEWRQDNLAALEGIRLAGALNNPVFTEVYNQPRLRAALDEMFAPEQLSDESYAQLFLTPYNPQAQPALSASGHIDYVNCPIPVLGRGFAFQVSLVDKEPFGGNICVWPGTHRIVQQAVMNNPDWRYPDNWDDIPQGEPFEFVGEAGDAFFFHHLIAHSGNVNATPMPRISLHCQAWQEEWPTYLDPAAPNLSPWERSLVPYGPYQIREDEQARREEDKQRASGMAMAR